MRNSETSRKLIAFDMFSGCGGLTEGLKAAGFSVVGAVELDEFAADNYELNHDEVELWRTDVRLLSVSEVKRKLEIETGELDLLAGCPPCQGFSTLRTRNGAVCGKDRRNTLLRDFLRFVEGLKPKAIMLENVPGLESYRLFKPFCKRLTALGYEGEFRILDASDYSVPQRRKRLIYLAGMRRKINFALAHEHKTTVRKVIGALATAGQSGDPIHDMPENRSDAIKERIALIPKDGGSRSHLPKSAQLKCHQKCDGFKDVYGRMAWDELAPTITGGCFNPSKGRFLHPEADRAITMREAALLQGFRADYRFSSDRGKVALAQMQHERAAGTLAPEYHRATVECPEPERWSMVDSVTAEVEVLEFLATLVTTVKPRLVVETGSFLGVSTEWIARGLERNGVGKVISCEFDPLVYERARARLEALQLGRGGVDFVVA